jgi:hypothetical protein
MSAVAGPADTATDLEAVEIGQLQVEHDRVRRAHGESPKGRGRVVEEFDVVVLQFQGPGEGRADGGVVVDDGDMAEWGGCGRDS